MKGNELMCVVLQRLPKKKKLVQTTKQQNYLGVNKHFFKQISIGWQQQQTH